MQRGSPSPLPGGRRLLPVTPRRSSSPLGHPQREHPLQVACEIAAKSRSAPSERSMENNSVSSDPSPKSQDPLTPDNIDIRSQTEDISDFHEEAALKKSPDKISRSSSRQDNSMSDTHESSGPRLSVRKALSLDYVKSLQRKASIPEQVPYKSMVFSSTQAFSKNEVTETGAFHHIDQIRADTRKNVPQGHNIVAHEACEGDVSAYPPLESEYNYDSGSLADLHCENINEIPLEDLDNLDLKTAEYNAGKPKELARVFTRWVNPVEGRTEEELQQKKKVLQLINRKIEAQKRGIHPRKLNESYYTEQELMEENQWQKEVESIIRRFEAQKREIRQLEVKGPYNADEELLEYQQKQKERELIIRKLKVLESTMKRNEVTDFHITDEELLEMEQKCREVNINGIEDSYSADEDLIEHEPWQLKAENISSFEVQKLAMDRHDVDDLYISEEDLLADGLRTNEGTQIFATFDATKDMKEYEMDAAYNTDNLLLVKQSQRDIEKLCRRLDAQKRGMKGQEVKEFKSRDQKLLKVDEWQKQVENISVTSEANGRERKRQEVNNVYVTEKELLTIRQRQKAREQIIRKLTATQTRNKNGLEVKDLNFTDRELLEYEQWQKDVEMMDRRLKAQKSNIKSHEMRGLYKWPLVKSEPFLPFHRVLKGVMASPSGNRLLYGVDCLETASCSQLDKRQHILTRPDILSHIDDLIRSTEHEQLHMLKLKGIEFE